jgi:hypothetical protein
VQNSVRPAVEALADEAAGLLQLVDDLALALSKD